MKHFGGNFKTKIKILQKQTMKKLLFIGAAIASLLTTASAQRSFDMFNVPKTIQLIGGQNFIATTGAITNSPVDVRMFDGLAVIDAFAYTNTGTTGGTMTLTVQTSSNPTNGFVNAQNLAFINTLYPITYTNSANTNLTATSQYLIPGTYTNQIPSVNFVAGWALLPPQYTNSGALTLPLGYSKIGFSVGDGGRYTRIILAPGGTTTNITAGVSFTGYNETPLQ